MNNDNKSGLRTLLMSMLVSLPAPLLLGFGLRFGHSSTQISDFVRRTSELTAIIVAFVLYVYTNRRQDMDGERKRQLERRGNIFTGVIMCVSGVSMILVTLLAGGGDKGNVIPAFALALLGAAANIFFWRRYTGLFKKQGNAIIGVQARLYGAKSVVDLCVTSALASVLLFPGTGFSQWFDVIGSLLVSLYMIRSGLKTIAEQKKA